MTAVDDRPATEIGAARKRKEDQRLITGRTRWTDNISCPGMLHLAMVRSPFAHATITAIDTTRGQGGARRRRGLHRRGHRRQPGRVPTRGRSTRSRRPRPTCPCAVDHVACAGEIVAVVAARAGRGRARRRRARRRRLRRAARRCSTSRRPPRTTVLAHPGLGTNKSRLLAARLRGRGHRRRRRRGHRQGARGRHRHRARVPAAAAHPGLHGAPLDGRRPDRRADDDLVGHPDPAHPALPHRRDDRASPSPRSGSSPPTSAAASAASCRRPPRSSSPSPSPVGSASRASTPRPARSRWCPATTAATSGRS